MLPIPQTTPSPYALTTRLIIGNKKKKKPGGHGERSTAVGTIDMAVWDVVSKIERLPLYEHLAKKYGDGNFTNRILFMLQVVIIIQEKIFRCFKMK